jgi:hypothetical protein
MPIVDDYAAIAAALRRIQAYCGKPAHSPAGALQERRARTNWAASTASNICQTAVSLSDNQSCGIVSSSLAEGALAFVA